MTANGHKITLSGLAAEGISGSRKNPRKTYSKPCLHAYGTVIAVTGSNKTLSFCDAMTLTFNGAMTDKTGCIAGEG